LVVGLSSWRETISLLGYCPHPSNPTPNVRTCYPSEGCCQSKKSSRCQLLPLCFNIHLRPNPLVVLGNVVPTYAAPEILEEFPQVNWSKLSVSCLGRSVYYGPGVVIIRAYWPPLVLNDSGVCPTNVPTRASRFLTTCRIYA
jgi:hypothetical protein